MRPLIVAGVLLGMGMGGFFDGIVLHQILQWHHLLSSAGYPTTNMENLQVNTLADGLFHAGTFVLTAAGLYALWRAARQATAAGSGRVLLGAGLTGWGGFNVVEGLIDHHLLQIHHVRPGPDQLTWDLIFLVWGMLMLAVGWWLTRHRTGEPGSERTRVRRQPSRTERV